MSNTIKFIRGAEADIPVLNQGEPAFTTDTHKVFIGDGAENHELLKVNDSIKCNNNASAAPAVTNDSTEGYVVNSIWADTTHDKSYICLDATEDNAVWTEITAATGIDKLNWVYPQDYATGTGTAIDPWAGDCINDAYAAASAGDTIYLRKGYYLLSTLLNIEGKGVNLIGEGMGKTFIITGMAATHAIRVVDDYVTLKGFTLDADSQNKSVGESTDLQGISLKDGNYITLEDVEVKNAGYAGIQYTDISYSTMRHLYIHDNAWLGIHQAHLTSTGGKHNTFKDIYTWSHTHQGFDDGGEVTPWTSDCDNVYDNINSWDNGEEGLVFWYMWGGKVINCTAWDSTTYGIYIGNSHELSLVNCSANYNHAHGIKIVNSDDIVLSHCVSKNNDVDDAGSKCGLVIENSDRLILDNCKFYDDRGTPQQDYGILTEGNCSDIQLINCKLAPNGTSTIGDFGTTTIISVNGVVDGYAAVAGDVMYHNGTNWVRLAKGTANQRLKMNAGATAPEWDTLTEADISDLGAYLVDVADDTSPTLGGNLDAADKYITGAGRISFTQELDNGTKDANFSVYFITDQKQKVTLTANTITLTLDTTSMGVGNYLLKIVNGGLATLTWASESGSIYFPGGTDPVLTASGTDIVAFYFDGTNWYGMASLDFK
jgi:parallel beta-helix repeat protein